MQHPFLLNIFLPLALSLTFCTQTQEGENDLTSGHETQVMDTDPPLINTNGNTIESRFNPLTNCERVSANSNSFGAYLRDLPLKSHGSSVKYFDGDVKKNNQVYVGVVDLPIGDRDLHQCADAIMRLRADYLRVQKRYDEIKFSFNNGFVADYSKWKEGYRISYNGDSFFWKKKASPSDSDESYWKYLEYVFSFAGTWSLEKELNAVTAENMKIGDIFIYGGSPGHAVIVVDMIEDKTTGQRYFMLAQSYMPAQEIQVLINPNNEETSPWYSTEIRNTLKTPEWVFDGDALKRF
ncbi:MAG: hypothetical protein COA32_06485 [Fluviicola sp.]|nr:MAG: hypothetical protein COA32_06485 [Fluviicola sp.]